MTSGGMRRLGEAALVVALLFGIFQSGCCLKFEVKNGTTNKSCILADLSIDFAVDYKMGDKQGISLFSLPENATVDNSSSCVTPLLVIGFGSGYSLSVNFTKSAEKYQVDQLMFTYNLSDKVSFPSSSENGTRQVSSNKTDISAKTNQFYQCSSKHIIAMGSVKATFHDIKLEAYLSSDGYSANATICKEDITPTSAPTHAPTPVPPTTTPVNPKTPDVGDYRVNETSGAACILAKMGLQLNITYLNKDGKNASYDFNIDPKQVVVNGNCSKPYSTLQLSSDKVVLLFNFTLNATEKKFYLGHVHANTIIPDAKDPNFTVDSGSLSFLQTTTTKSYKCNSKQTLQITDTFSIDTYSLQVQAFGIDGNKFGPAVDCAADQNGMLVPIVVGAALAGLVLIVLIAYLIGRKRSHAGYQTI